ncbi:hypothetical protein, partial [Arthrobacter sp. E3]|uniref:hypothetical protein n=1 Tax=Arthrobacter sp. E3 TaxID=517402 RepID=UPI001A94A22E
RLPHPRQMLQVLRPPHTLPIRQNPHINTKRQPTTTALATTRIPDRTNTGTRAASATGSGTGTSTGRRTH